MGSQVMEIAVWLWSLAIVSVFLGLVFNILRGMFDGYMDKWEEKYLVNKKAEYLDDDYLEPNDDLKREAERYQDVIDKTYDAARPYYGDLDEDEIDDEDDPFDDPDVLDFLERADEQGPWSEEDDKIYTVGGLTADKDQGFKKFINKIEGGDSDNVDDEETK